MFPLPPQTSMTGMVLLSLVLTALPTGCATAPSADTPSTATPPADAPADAAALHAYVNAAAVKVQREGIDAFTAFADPAGHWRHRDVQLMVLDDQGVVRFHSHVRHMVGDDVTGLTDIDGRPFIHWLLAATATQRGAGWAFHRWPPANELMPTWTATLARRVTGPDEAAWIVVGSAADLPLDDALIDAMIDTAIAYARQHGPAAITEGRGPFTYRDARVAITDDTAAAKLQRPRRVTLDGRTLTVGVTQRDDSPASRP